jgi:arylsulfatase A-like enzyme
LGKHVWTLCQDGAGAMGRAQRVNIVLALSDDQGWGEVSYRGHTHLPTPGLDRMAAHGLRFERFYSGAPICSAARAALLTGRSPHRTGVTTQGQPLRLQEQTLATALRKAGYATAHYGKWHLDGIHGFGTALGAPVIATHSHNPGAFGFQTWLSNFGVFDLNPVLGRMEGVDAYPGEPCAILVRKAIEFMEESVKQRQRFFATVWFSNPHLPWIPQARFVQPFRNVTRCRHYRNLTACQIKGEGHRKGEYDYRRDCDCFPREMAEHYGELAALDKSIDDLRRGLRLLGVENDTLLWFSSDNGPEPKQYRPFPPAGGLAGAKKSLLEGGIRVPAIVEWPGKIDPRITWHPACAMDVFPTIAELVGLPEASMLQPQDGVSLVRLFKHEIGLRTKPIPFAYFNNHQFGNGWAIIDNNFKLVRWSSSWARRTYVRPAAKPVNARSARDNSPKSQAQLRSERLLKRQTTLFDVVADSEERVNLIGRWDDPEVAAALVRLEAALDLFARSTNASQHGLDYPGQRIWAQPPIGVWCELECYGPFTARITELTRRGSHLSQMFECGVFLNQTLHPTMKGIEGDGSSASASGPTTCKTSNSKCMNEWPWRDLPNKWSSMEGR